MAWSRENGEQFLPRRALNRELAARFPFLLDAELGNAHWPDRRGWAVRSVVDFGVGFHGAELLALATRLQRVLVTRDPGFLSDVLYAPDSCAGVVVVDERRGTPMDEFLMTIVELLGPFRWLYRGVKIHGEAGGRVTITAPAGRNRRVTRRFVIDAGGVPQLSEVENSDGRVYGYSGYRQPGTRHRDSYQVPGRFEERRQVRRAI